MDSLANEEYNSDILCRAKQLSIIRIVFVTHDQEATQWFSRPDPVFLFSYGCHHTHRYTIFAGLKYRRGYFTSCLIFFPSPEGTRIKEGNEQDFFSYYMINNRKGIYHSTIIRNIFLEHAAMLG